MQYVIVKFTNYDKQYIYKTNLNLIENGIYDIIADDITTYSNPVQVIKTNISHISNFSSKIREITAATIIKAPRKPDGNVKLINVNKEKGIVVVVWKDKTVTKVKCNEYDDFDIEKGIAMCFMKKAFNNRGCYNDLIKEVINKYSLKE